jgi:hypothetical protein
LLIGLASLLVLALSIPGVAAATPGPYWLANGQKLGVAEEEEPTLAVAEGHLTLWFGGFYSLSCDASGEAEFINGPAGGEGQIGQLGLQNCNVSNGQVHCNVPNVFGGIYALFADSEHNINSNAEFTAFTSGCPLTPEVIRAEGTLESYYDNESECFKYEESGSLHTGTGVKVTTLGELCLESEAGKLTLGEEGLSLN